MSWSAPRFDADLTGNGKPMALGKLQSVAKNMSCFFHGIRRLNLWNSVFPLNTGKPICPRGLPGYCALEYEKINYGIVFLWNFWLPACNFPNANKPSSGICSMKNGNAEE